MLQVELASALKAVAALQEAQKFTNSLQEQVLQFELDRDKWRQLFSNFRPSAEGIADANPSYVFNAFTDMQRRLVALTAQCGDAKTACAELQFRLTRAEAALVEKDSLLASLRHSQSASALEGNFAKRQSTLFEREMQCLRDVLDSYEAEYRIGRPTALAIDGIKDKLVSSLRTEVDELRQRLQQETCFTGGSLMVVCTCSWCNVCV